MSTRTPQQQYEYETGVRGLDHRTALDQMKWMFSPEELKRLETYRWLGQFVTTPDGCGTVVEIMDDRCAVDMISGGTWEGSMEDTK